MANINDIESLFSLIGQSPNDYKEFYHEKNGLHALDKWSYLKNIQLENPNEEGISIFENGPINPSDTSSVSSIPSAPIASTPINQAGSVEKVTSFTPPDVVISAPKVERYSSPVIEAKTTVNLDNDLIAPQPSTFTEENVAFTKPESIQTPDPLEPLTPAIYNPVAVTQAVPQAPKIYSTTSIPTVPTFSTSFNNPMNASTSSTFTSSFIKPTAPSNSNLQSTFTPPRFEPAPIVKTPSEPEVKPNTTTASPLNSIFSRLEQK